MLLTGRWDGTSGLPGLHGRSQQSPQQVGDGHPDVVVGPVKRSETQRGHVLQLAGPQERRLPLQLQQTLPEPHGDGVINSYNTADERRKDRSSGVTLAAAQRTAKDRSVRHVLAAL